MLRPHHQMLKCVVYGIICIANGVLGTFIGDALPSTTYQSCVTMLFGVLALTNTLEYFIYETNIIKLRRLIKNMNDWEIKVTPATI